MCDLTEYIKNVTGKTSIACDAAISTTGWGFRANVCARHYGLVEILFRTPPNTMDRIVDAKGEVVGNDLARLAAASIAGPINASNGGFNRDFVYSPMFGCYRV